MNAPADIVTARQLWWGVIGVGIARSLVTLVDTLVNTEQVSDRLREQLPDGEPEFTPAMIHLMAQLSGVLGVIFALVLAGLGLWIVHQLGRGKLWARTLLTFVGVWLVIMGVISLVSIGTVDGTGPMVAGAGSIVQAVLAAGAIFLCQRAEATDWFAPRGPDGSGNP